MHIIAIGCFLGAFLLSFFIVLPDPTRLLFILLPVAFLCYFLPRYRSAFLFFISLIISLVYASMTAFSIIESRLTPQFEGKNLIIEGKIDNIPIHHPTHWQFYFKVSKATFFDEANKSVPLNLNGKIKLAWYGAKPSLHAGDHWRFEVRLKRPNGFMNQGGLDYEKWLFTQRISATGYVRSSRNNQQLDSAPWYAINAFREKIQQNIKQSIPDAQVLGLITALAIASRDAVSDDQWQLFRQTGTSHLIAISGLHIGLVAGLGYFFIALLWWLFPSLYLYLPVRIAGAGLALILAVAYAVLAGFSLPTQRSLVMVVGGIIALLQQQYFQRFSFFSLAILMVLLIDPLAPLTISFYLSFGAVLLILLFFARQTRPPKFSLLSLQFMLSFGMFPLTLFFFGQVSVISPLANLIAVPWVTLVIVPLILLTLIMFLVAPVLADFILQGVVFNLDYLLRMLTWLDQFPFTVFDAKDLSLPLILTLMLGLLLLFLPKGFPARWLGILLFIPIITHEPKATLNKGEFRYSLLDVGQGLASVIETQQHVLVYDTGAKYSKRFDTGKLVLLPFLQSKSIRQIDKMVLSHEDMDHRGGTLAVLEVIKVDEIISSQLTFLHDKKMTLCRAGDQWEWEGVQFEFLHPYANFPESESDNNHSCVLRISNANHSLLLVGDIEKKVERILLRDQKDKLRSDVLLVPHHGSRTSSTLAFIDAVSPKIALNTTGYRNKFRHPVKSVVQRYQHRNIPLYDTVNRGMISVFFPSNHHPFVLSSYREDHLKYWHIKK